MNFLAANLKSPNNDWGTSRSQLGYALTAAAISGDSVIFEEGQLLASTTASGDSVIMDKSSLLAAAAPIKIARRK